MPKNSAVVSTISAVILAGGQGRRLGGKEKSQLKLGQQTLLERSLEAMASLSDDVIVVINDQEPLGKLKARIINDVIPGSGALSGLHAGLTAARHDYALVIACDMPFLNMRLLRYMVVIVPGYDAIVPQWQGNLEPLHALYARTCLPAIETLLHSGGKRIFDFYLQVNVRYLERGEITLFDPEGLTFFNVNTPADWERAQEIQITWSQRSNE